MTRKESAEESQEMRWMRRYAKGIGGLSIATVGIAAAAYEVYRRRQQAAKNFEKTRRLFEFDSEEPSEKTLAVRHLAATALANPEGISTEAIIAGPETTAERRVVREALRLLTRQQVLTSFEYEDPTIVAGRRNFIYVRPTEGFVDAIIARTPKWQPLIDQATELNPTFSLEAVAAVISPNDVSGNS